MAQLLGVRVAGEDEMLTDYAGRLEVFTLQQDLVRSARMTGVTPAGAGA